MKTIKVYKEFVNENNENLVTTFMMGCEDGRIEPIRDVIDKIDKNTINNGLLSATKNGHIDIIEILLDNGADIHYRNDLILQLACKYGHMDVVVFLLDKNADVEADNQKAIKLAEENGHTNIVDILKDHLSTSKFQISNLDIYYILTLIYRIPGISYDSMNRTLRSIGLSEFQSKWSANLRECARPIITNNSHEKRFIYDSNNRRYFPLSSYLENNSEIIKSTIYFILDKMTESAHNRLLVTLFSEIINNTLRITDRNVPDFEIPDTEDIIDTEKSISKSIGARQQHGFNYQKKACIKYGITKSGGYTDAWDGQSSSYVNDLPVSIKCATHRGEITLAKFRRQVEIDKDFLLIVGFWSGQKENIVEEYAIKVPIDSWKQWFGDIDAIGDMEQEFFAISNSYDDDDRFHQFCDIYNELYNGDKNPIIKLRFKRDHKKQRRIQCAISYNDFINVVLPKCEKIDINEIKSEKEIKIDTTT